MAVDDVKSPGNVHTTLSELLKSHARRNTAWFATVALNDVSKIRGIRAGSLHPPVNILAQCLLRELSRIWPVVSSSKPLIAHKSFLTDTETCV